jgi:hypothetical protein
MVLTFDPVGTIESECDLSTGTHDYLVCGLRLRTNVAFPLLTQTETGAPDVEFSLKAEGVQTTELFPDRVFLGTIRNGAGRPSITVSRVKEGQLLECENGSKGAAFFLSQNWGTIECYPAPGMSRQDIECWLFGLVLAYLLQRRNIFSLHGAAVECHGKAIGFLGNNGYGKSTLAYFFLRKGHRLVTDDVLALVDQGTHFMALPACPSMNLWPKTMTELGSENVNLSTSELKEMKARLSLRSTDSLFSRSEVPLDRLYLLSPIQEGYGNRVEISQVSPSLGLRELFRHTRAGSVLGMDDQKRLMQFFGRLSSTVSIRQLQFAGGFDKLPAIYEAILQDVLSSTTKGDAATRD